MQVPLLEEARSRGPLPRVRPAPEPPLQAALLEALLLREAPLEGPLERRKPETRRREEHRAVIRPLQARLAGKREQARNPIQGHWLVRTRSSQPTARSAWTAPAQPLRP